MGKFISLDLINRGGKFIAPPVKEDERRKATLVVANHSNSVDECRELLVMLGLMGDDSNDS